MFQRVSDEEIARRKIRLAQLYGSLDVVENVTAILMDTAVGNFGMVEKSAREKAELIVRLVNDFNDIP